MILVQLKLKLQIEHEFDKPEVTREWTKMRCENIQEYNKVVIQVSCSACNANPLQMNTGNFITFPYDNLTDTSISFYLSNSDSKSYL